MPRPEQIERLGRVLVPVIAVLLLAGVVSTRVRGVDDARVQRAELTPSGTVAGGAGEPSGAVVPPAEVSDPGAESADTPPVPTTLPLLGRSVVPLAGIYRYEVDSVRDGVSSSRTETREISVSGVEGDAAIVQIVADSDGERQVSQLRWSPDQVRVQATRIESGSQPARDCAWEPAFTEFGPLQPNATWTLDSTCTTEVAGLPTRFVVRGTGGVVGEVVVVHAGANVRVWQIERDRTTTILATVGEDEVEQTVQETGTFFVDPTRGLVLRSDVTVTLSGAQQGVTRRTSVLTEG